MDAKKSAKHKLKRDKYVKARGGNSHFLDLYCSRCGQHFALYQKDGKGDLLRTYLDRIVAPEELSALQYAGKGKNELPNLCCASCGSVIGTPMVYEPENRLAFRLMRGLFSHKKSDGAYPPLILNQKK